MWKKLGATTVVLGALATAPVIPDEMQFVYAYQGRIDEMKAARAVIAATSTPIKELPPLPQDDDKNGVLSMAVFVNRAGNEVHVRIPDALYTEMQGRKEDGKGALKNPRQQEYISFFESLQAEQANAAIAFDAANQQAVTAGTASITFSLTNSATTPGLMIGVTVQNTGGLTGAPTYNGVSSTLIDSQQDSGITVVYLYYLINPASGANNLSVTRNTTTNSMYLFGVTYYDFAQSSPIDTSTKGTTGDPMTGTVTTTVDNCWTFMNAYDGNQALSASTGSTLRGSTLQSNAGGVFDSNGPKTPAGMTSMAVNVATGGSATAFVMAAFCPAVASAEDDTYFDLI